MPQPTNAVIWIENNIINFFAAKYRQPANLFNWDTNVRRAFALLPTDRWQSLGRELNRQNWLISIHVLIDVESSDWGKAASVGEITTYIHGIYQAHRNFVAKLKIDKILISDTAPSGTKKAGKKKKGSKEKKEKKKKDGG